MNFRNTGKESNILRPENRSFFDRYVREIAKFKVLSKEEEEELFVKYEETGDQEILKKICSHNLLFVVTVARHYGKSLPINSGIVLEDLINEGNLGLCLAVKRFDYRTGYKFISYAVWFIRQHILNCLQFNTKNIRIPFSAREEILYYKNKKDEFEKEIGHEIDLVDLYNFLLKEGNVKDSDDFRKIEHLLRMNSFETRLNMKVNDDDDMELIDSLKSTDEYLADTNINNSDITNTVNYILSKLDIKTEKFMRDYFGINLEEPMSLKDIAIKYKTNPTNVRNHINRGFRTIKLLKSRNKLLFDI